MIWGNWPSAKIAAMEAELSRLSEEVRELRPGQIMTATIEFTDGNNELSGFTVYDVEFAISASERKMLKPLTVKVGKHLKAINAALVTFADGRRFCAGVRHFPEAICENAEFFVNDFRIEIDPNLGKRVPE